MRPVLNFIKILYTAFTLVGPKSAIIKSSNQYFFLLLGSTGAKVVSKLMKFTPDPESAKKTNVLTVFFALLGPAWIKCW